MSRSDNCQTADFPDLPVQPKIKKIWNGSIFGQLFGRSVGLSVGWWQRSADTNATLAFEDAQVIQPFSREETDDTDNTDDTDDTDDTGIGWKRLE